VYNLTATLLECMQTEGSAPCCQHSYICWLGDRFTVPLCKWSIFLISRSHKYDLCSDETWMLNKPRKSFMQPMTVCLPWLNSYRCHTHNCMPGCESILAVTGSWLISVCGFCLCGIRSRKAHVWCFLGIEELLDLLQSCWLGTAGPFPWPGRSCEFTLLDSVFWDYVTEYIYIWPFCHSPVRKTHWNGTCFETCSLLGILCSRKW